MGISSAMTPKDRKVIHAGLLDQGAVVVREGKRGTLYKMPNDQRWMLPFGTGDHKARLAMRAEVRRLGLHWPLDPPERKKETTTMTSTMTEARPELRPASVDPNAMATEATYRVLEPTLRKWAQREFWTNELSKEVTETVPGYRSSATGQRVTRMLWFAGFRPFESKPMTGGTAYRWRRDPALPWPTEFAPPMPRPGLGRVTASTSVDGTTVSVGTDEVEPAAEQAEVATITKSKVVPADAELRELTLADMPQREEQPSEQDVELTLAVEMEQRAIKAERERDGLRVSLDREMKAHNATRRDLLVRIANWEQKHETATKEIERLRSLLQERELAAKELTPAPRVADDGPLRDTIAELERQLAEQTKVAEHWHHRAVDAGDEGWWPLEAGEQTVSQLIQGASGFGLEVRVQARRKG